MNKLLLWLLFYNYLTHPCQGYRYVKPSIIPPISIDNFSEDDFYEYASLKQACKCIKREEINKKRSIDNIRDTISDFLVKVNSRAAWRVLIELDKNDWNLC